MIIIGYLILLLLLLLGSITSVLFSPRCAHKPLLDWYQKDLIYEIDLKMFRDSNDDGIGDIVGLQQKFDYLQKNFIKTILLRSTIFNSTHLLTFNEQILNQTQLQNFIKIIHRKGFFIFFIFY
jgi:hypothetical protein